MRKVERKMDLLLLILLAHPLEGQGVLIATHEPSLHLLGVIPGHPGSTGQSRLVSAQEPSQQLQSPQVCAVHCDGLGTHDPSMHRNGFEGGHEGITHWVMELTQVPSGHRIGQLVLPPVVLPVVEAIPVVEPIPVVALMPGESRHKSLKNPIVQFQPQNNKQQKKEYLQLCYLLRHTTTSCHSSQSTVGTKCTVHLELCLLCPLPEFHMFLGKGERE